ncbi:MAG: AAA family ATPase [Gammaproteobacteria bacterium]|nr:AAA family ATPase [Gammaproteobacteria bacterium]
MKRGEAQQTLAAINRWWRDPEGWTARDPDLREMERAPFRYQADVLADLIPGGLYILRGPRRVGKTVAVKSAIRDLAASGVAPRCIVHMAMDGLRSRDLGLLVDAADGLMPADGHRYWFIDEITGITDGWPERVKWLRDNDARFRTDTVVLTGSSAAGLTQATKALAGRRGEARAPDRVLLPMGFRSFARLVSGATALEQSALKPYRVADLTHGELRQVLPELAPWQDLLIRAWETYLGCGGFPAAVAQHVATRSEPSALRRSLVDVIHGDAFRRADWSQTQSTDLLRRLSANVCSPLNIASLANDTGVAQATLKRRLDELREAFVVWPCYREDNLRPKLGAQPKLYFMDPIYANLTLDSERVAPRTHLDFSRLSQQQLGLALLRAIERDAPGTLVGHDQVLHHRTASRKEIDFVGPQFGGAAFESKYVDGGWRREALTLKASRWQGVVATRSESDLSDPEVAAVPTALLAWLLDS